jgi:dihydrofolate reductase
MHTETPQLAVSRVFDAPRALVFRAFTDPDHLATWWGPSGNTLPRDEIEFDVRPGGFQRWTEVAAAELVYLTNTSLDGYIEDEHGAFDWAPPDDDVFAATTALLSSFGTFLYGRRLYEAMAVWETNPALAEQSDLTAEFASVWQAGAKVVYSTTLTAVSTATTRLERDFDPAAVRELKGTATSDLTIGGASLAAQAMAAGLVDECQLFVWPMIVGGGKPALPAGIRTNLELLDEHRFDNGAVHLRYRIPT